MITVHKVHILEKGFSNLFVDKIKSFVACSASVLLIALKDKLPDSKSYVKTESVVNFSSLA